jgi:hypothetical protein
MEVMWLSLLLKTLIRVGVVVALAYVLHTCILKQLVNLHVKEDDGVLIKACHIEIRA